MRRPPTWAGTRVGAVGFCMGGGMAIEDSVVLAQCISSGPTVPEALQAFMDRRLSRVRTVVETSVALSHMEQSGAPPEENRKLMGTAFATISKPY